jgi:hypothetical protein
LLYSPPIILGVVFFRRFFRQHSAEALLFAGISVVYVLMYASWWYWDGGWSWGPRFMLPVVALLMVPTTFALESRWGRAALGTLALLGLLIQVLGVVINYNLSTQLLWANGVVDERWAIFIPEISAIPLHLQLVLVGELYDLWILKVYQEFGFPVLAGTVLALLSILGAALYLLLDRRELALARQRGARLLDFRDAVVGRWRSLPG